MLRGLISIPERTREPNLLFRWIRAFCRKLFIRRPRRGGYLHSRSWFSILYVSVTLCFMVWVVVHEKTRKTETFPSPNKMSYRSVKFRGNI